MYITKKKKTSAKKHEEEKYNYNIYLNIITRYKYFQQNI